MRKPVVVCLIFFAAGSALAQQPAEPTVTFRLPQSQADQLERLLAPLGAKEFGPLYWNIQGQIIAAGNVALQAQRDAVIKGAIDQHDKELADKAKSAVAPDQPKE